MPTSGILREILIGGLVLGSVGVLCGTWLGISYGRERRRAPSAFAVLFYGGLFGVPGFIIGGLLGGLVHIIALALSIDPSHNLSAFVIGGLCIIVLTGLVIRSHLKRTAALQRPPVSPGRWVTRFPKLPQVQYRPVNLQVEALDSLKIVVAACSLAHFSPDSRWLLTSSGDQAFVWDTDTFSVKKKLKKISEFAFSQDSLHLAVRQPSDGQIQVVELQSGRVTDRIFGRHLPPGQVSSLRFHPTAPALVINVHPTYNPAALDRYDRMRLAGASSSVTRPVFGRRRALEHAQENSEIQAGRYAVKKKRDWILDRENNLLVDAESGETVHRLDDLVEFRHITISPDGRYAAGIDPRRETLCVRDLDTGKTITHSDERFQVNAELMFSPDSAVLLVRGDPAVWVRGR